MRKYLFRGKKVKKKKKLTFYICNFSETATFPEIVSWHPSDEKQNIHTKKN